MDNRSYYVSNILRLMCVVEDHYGQTKMFHELYPEIESAWVEADKIACENVDHTRPLMRVYNQLCKLIDDLNMD